LSAKNKKTLTRKTNQQKATKEIRLFFFKEEIKEKRRIKRGYIDGAD